MKSRIFALLGSVILVVVCLSGCASTDVGAEGRAPSEVAVITMLKAAVDNDPGAARKVLAPFSKEDIAINLAGVSDFVAAVGGMENLTVLEIESERMGAIHAVSVRATDLSVERTFEVVEDGGKFTVVPWEGFVSPLLEPN